MPDRVRIRLEPLGKMIEVARGVPLRDVLFDFGVEFPCGGHGRCRSCRVKVVDGALPLSPEQEAILSRREVLEGWRLACRCLAESDVTLEINQWEAAILSDDSSLAFKPGEGLGVAVDLGTTTLVAQLADLASGKVLSVQTALNPQAAYGGDVMSRVQFALSPEGRTRMTDLIREGIVRLIRNACNEAGMPDAPVRKIVLVGNTVMHHLFSDLDITPLAYYPFESVQDGAQTFRSADIGWDVTGNPEVHFLPCLGGFVGSDILAGILAVGIHKSDALVGLIDLGTNGEVVFGNRQRLLCASTAAGPAFEGARIRMGMRAATGAISEVWIDGGRLHCHVLGGTAPRGLCGSGLVDAVAAGLELGVIQPSGRFNQGFNEFVLAPPVSIHQGDIRELQLAKGAIAAAVQLLLTEWGAEPADVKTLYLAGAFGNYVDKTSARRIGLVDFPPEIVQPAGNTALRGAKLALFEGEGDDPEFSSLRRKVEHMPLAANPRFEEVFVELMAFP